MEVGTNTLTNFILVHIGNHFVDYINDCIEQITKFNKSNIFLVINSEHFDKIRNKNVILINPENIEKTNHHKFFIKNNGLNSVFRDGLCLHSVDRFFYIEEVMIKYHLSNVFHLENDNLIYFDVNELLDCFIENYDISTPFDNDSRAIPGFMYIKNVECLTDFNKFVTINNKIGDMEILSIYNRTKNKKLNLPVIPNNYDFELVSSTNLKTDFPNHYWLNYNQFKSIFDGAAFGQYIGGIDPKNQPGDTSGFINESSLYNPKNFKIFFNIDEDGRKVPFVEFKNEICRINNLHIHCKNLKKFM